MIATTLPSIVTGQKLRAAVRLKLATVASIDLNVDLGESFGGWRLGDDDAVAEAIHMVNANVPMLGLAVQDRLQAAGIDVKAFR